MPTPVSARAQHAASLTGRPPQPRSGSARAQHAAGLTGQPPQPRLPPRAHLATAGRAPGHEHLGKPRALPAPIAGAQDLVGQVLRLADGRSIRVVGLEVVQPDTADTYAGAHSYGCAADATFVARPRPPAGPLARRLAVTRSLGRSRPAVAAADATAVARPRDPYEVRPPAAAAPEPLLSRQQQAAAQIDATESNFNSFGDMIEGSGLINKSIGPVNNSAFRLAQRVNRLAGRKVIVPSRLASNAARVVRTVAPAKLARLGGKFGKVAGPAGMVLTTINIAIELDTNTADAHTAVDGVMLVVTGGILVAGAAGLAIAASPVVVAVGAVIVVYGILDYAFDIGEKVIDPAIGRKSGLWD